MYDYLLLLLLGKERNKKKSPQVLVSSRKQDQNITYTYEFYDHFS